MSAEQTVGPMYSRIPDQSGWAGGDEVAEEQARIKAQQRAERRAKKREEAARRRESLARSRAPDQEAREAFEREADKVKAAAVGDLAEQLHAAAAELAGLEAEQETIGRRVKEARRAEDPVEYLRAENRREDLPGLISDARRRLAEVDDQVVTAESRALDERAADHLRRAEQLQTNVDEAQHRLEALKQEQADERNTARRWEVEASRVREDHDRRQQGRR